jgi:hypothetical protein
VSEPTLFVATPLHSGWLHYAYVAGALQAMTAFAGRIAFQVQTGSFLPINRDVLTARFLESAATHMLCIDSDIGWTPADAQALLATRKDFISGCYPKKQPNPTVPAKLTGHRQGDIWEAEYVPGGFLLLSRACVERMVGAYRALEYKRDGMKLWALWSSLFIDGETYAGEDVAFCNRWRALGGQVWLHQGVALKHYGETCFEIPGSK